VIHHFRIQSKLKGDIIQRPNEIAFQIFHCPKDIVLSATLLLGKLFDEFLLLLIELFQVVFLIRYGYPNSLYIICSRHLLTLYFPLCPLHGCLIRIIHHHLIRNGRYYQLLRQQPPIFLAFHFSHIPLDPLP
jgi:hypothetical protein